MQPQPDRRTPPADGGNDLLQQAKQTTSDVVGQVQQQAGSRITRQKDEAANEIQKVAGAVRQLGDQLGGQDQGPIAHYAAEYGRKAADGLERLTNYLRNNEPKAMMNELESLGRRQPVLLIGGAFLLGLAGARFLKSSRPAMSGSMTGSSYPDLDRSLTSPPQQPAHTSTTSATL